MGKSLFLMIGALTSNLHHKDEWGKRASIAMTGISVNLSRSKGRIFTSHYSSNEHKRLG
jgi:hypothetical protein